MKNLFKILMVVVGVQAPAYSQCDYDVLTNPAGPTNLQLPDADGVMGGAYTADSRYLNGLTWWNGNQYVLNNMYYNTTQPYMSPAVNIQDGNLTSSGYYSYLNILLGREEMTPANGWEIVLANLGYYPNNISANSSTSLNSVPYLVFYNKYTAVIRAFVMYGYNEAPPNAPDGVKISLSYFNATGWNNLSGILRTASGGEKALDQASPIDQIVAVAPTAGGANHWMSADFQMAYDPCVCSKPTIMSMGFDFFKDSQLSLHGRSISLVQPVDDIIDANGDVKDNNFLAGLNTENGTGFVIYDQMKDMATQYRNDLQEYKDALDAANEHNEKVERNLAILNAFVDVANLGLAIATDGASWAALAVEAPDVFFEEGEDGEENPRKEHFYETVEEILGEHIKEYISKKFEKVELPEEPVRPTATYTEMNFVGTVTSTATVAGPTFITPGGFNKTSTLTATNTAYANKPYGYPIYNQPLGVFALLETPQIARSYVKSNTMTRTGPFTDGHNSPFTAGISHYHYTGDFDNKYQFKLQSPLKYAFNPALDITSSSIECALVIVPKNRHFVDKPNFGFGNALSYTRKVYDESVNLTSDQINTYESEMIAHKEFSPSIDVQAHNLETITFMTPYMDINAFQTYVSQIKTESDIFELFFEASGGFPWTDNTTSYGMFWDQFDVQLKMKVDVTYAGVNQNGNTNDFTYLYTYPVNLGTASSTDLYANLSGSAGDVEQYPENLVFDGSVFDGSAVAGCALGGTTYTCKAWNDITIKNTLTANSGYQVNFIAGHEIFALAPSYIPPTMTLSIAPVLDYSSPMPETSAANVLAFCNSSTYQANVKSGAQQQINTNPGGGHPTSSVNSLGQGQFVDFEIYPNPTKTGSHVKILANEETAGTIRITDVTGKSVESSTVKAGFNLYEIDLKPYKSGVYFITVTTSQGSSTKQLIKE